jgi:hypothetical protein
MQLLRSGNTALFVTRRLSQLIRSLLVTSDKVDLVYQSGSIRSLLESTRQLNSPRTSCFAASLPHLILDKSLYFLYFLTTMLFSMQTLFFGITLPAVLQMVSATPTSRTFEVPAGLRIVEQYQSQSGNGTITW